MQCFAGCNFFGDDSELMRGGGADFGWHGRETVPQRWCGLWVARSGDRSTTGPVVTRSPDRVTFSTEGLPFVGLHQGIGVRGTSTSCCPLEKYQAAEDQRHSCGNR